MIRRPPRSTLFPLHDALPISGAAAFAGLEDRGAARGIFLDQRALPGRFRDRKSTRLNSSHLVISYAVFCLKKKKKILQSSRQEIDYLGRLSLVSARHIHTSRT